MLRQIGIEVRLGSVPAETFLAGMTIGEGCLVVERHPVTGWWARRRFVPTAFRIGQPQEGAALVDCQSR